LDTIQIINRRVKLMSKYSQISDYLVSFLDNEV